MIMNIYRAVSSTTSALFFPLIPFILHLFAIAFGVAVFLYLASVGEPEYKISGNDTNCVCDSEGISLGYNIPGSLCHPITFKEHCHQAGAKSLLSFIRADARENCIDVSCHYLNIQNPNIINYFHVNYTLAIQK